MEKLRPLCCKAMYRRISIKPATFGPQLVNCVLLLHEDGGIYRILTSSGTVRTKHVVYDEEVFRGLPGIFQNSTDQDGYNEVPVDDTESSTLSMGESIDGFKPEEVTYSSAHQHDSNHGKEVQNKVDSLTYVPIMFGQSDLESVGIGEQENEYVPNPAE